MTTNDGGPAFPAVLNGWEGMSLRDWFAGMAMQGLVTDGMFREYRDAEPEPEPTWEALSGNMRLIACTAYSIADAMIFARSREVQS